MYLFCQTHYSVSHSYVKWLSYDHIWCVSSSSSYILLQKVIKTLVMASTNSTGAYILYPLTIYFHNSIIWKQPWEKRRRGREHWRSSHFSLFSLSFPFSSTPSPHTFYSLLPLLPNLPYSPSNQEGSKLWHYWHPICSKLWTSLLGRRQGGLLLVEI